MRSRIADGQPLVGGVHVAPERVAADGRHLDGAQHRAERRHLAPRDVAVPHVLVALLVDALLEPDDLRHLSLREERVHLELAPHRREVTVLGTAQVLVAEEDDLPLEQGPLQLVERVVVDRAPQVDVAEDGADRRAQRRDREAAVGVALGAVGQAVQSDRSGDELGHGVSPPGEGRGEVERGPGGPGAELDQRLGRDGRVDPSACDGHGVGANQVRRLRPAEVSTESRPG